VEVIANLALIEAESGMGVEGKWAASDAALIFARWQKIIEHRRAFLTEYFSGEWPEREPWKR